MKNRVKFDEIEWSNVKENTVSITWRNSIGPELIIWDGEIGKSGTRIDYYVTIPKALRTAITKYTRDCIDGD